MNKITEASKILNDNLNLLNEAKILELEAHIWDLKSTISGFHKVFTNWRMEPGLRIEANSKRS